ncbi:MAG: hypothetical protein KGH98_01905 [Candidatus Micrarchaeota archaeon]|nr:hypothetical protein [Candidatus Micrarchaeota archaeon]
MNRIVCALALLVLIAAPTLASASYTVTNLNATVALNKNTSAQVSEILTLKISNVSINQYSTDRVAFNLTLSNWQLLIGPVLTQHIINPRAPSYNFKFLPGPVTGYGDIQTAELFMSYTVPNVTTVNQTAPRTFVYSLNPAIFNFEQGASGGVLSPNTTLNIDVPAGATIKSVYPLADIPAYGFEKNYTNVTSLTWDKGEPLSKFALVYTTNEGIQDEVLGFLDSAYNALGGFTYVIIAAIIVLFIVYTYLKAVY